MASNKLVKFAEMDFELILKWTGKISLIVNSKNKLSTLNQKLDKKVGGVITKALNSKNFNSLKEGEGVELAFPYGLKAESLQIIKLGLNPEAMKARSAGSTMSRFKSHSDLLIVSGPQKNINEVLFGLSLKSYNFENYKTQRKNTSTKILCLLEDIKLASESFKKYESVARSVFFCRDLVNEPANVLGTAEFSKRLKDLEQLGLVVEIFDEAALKKLGMRALLAVGQGSDSPSKVVVLTWNGTSKSTNPLVLIGKGVVFDTGGISLKPASGMEEMTMDMGGAAVVAGVMKGLALQKSKSNVIGIIGLVENMPDGKAQRPGDVVESMKGDTIEVVNTDAEGRLVLCDLLWYAQKTYSPEAIIDLATLTGAIIVSLGHENAGVFSNNNKFCGQFLDSAKSEGEGAWQMPLSSNYEQLLKSRIADTSNVGGRTAGAITAAKFLQRFVEKEIPWVHVDIAGVAFLKAPHKFGPKGATGWGVMTINKLIESKFEKT